MASSMRYGDWADIQKSDIPFQELLVLGEEQDPDVIRALLLSRLPLNYGVLNPNPEHVKFYKSRIVE